MTIAEQTPTPTTSDYVQRVEIVDDHQGPMHVTHRVLFDGEQVHLPGSGHFPDAVGPAGPLHVSLQWSVSGSRQEPTVLTLPVYRRDLQVQMLRDWDHRQPGTPTWTVEVCGRQVLTPKEMPRLVQSVLPPGAGEHPCDVFEVSLFVGEFVVRGQAAT